MATILVIDDELAVRKYLKALLTKLGHDIRTANDSQSGWQEAQHQDVKLIITDLVMPGEVTGMDFVRKLRGLRPDCPIIVVSGYPQPDWLKQSADLGVQFLTKPFEVPFLTEIVQRLLPADSSVGSIQSNPE